jgi:hypothetical protein
MFRREYPFKRSNPFSRRSILARDSDSLFNDMKKYQTGHDEQGNPRFSVPLTADEDGLLGRECPAPGCALRYFKVSVEKDESGEKPLTDAQLTCPYCSHRDSFQEFHTQAQLKWVESMMLRDVEQTMVRKLNDAFRPLNNMRGGLIKLKMTARATCLPVVHKYVEEQLKQTTACPECAQQYAVYGVSYHCPFCAGGTLSVHLRDSVTTIRVLAAEAAWIGQEHGPAAHDKMLGNAYEDAVTLFEGFLKLIYGYGVRKTFPPAEADRLQQHVRTSFQRLDAAEQLLRRDLSVELFQSVRQPDHDWLATVFCKRHALTHNLGLVDQRYRDQVRAWEKPGQEVPLAAAEIAWAVDLIENRLSDVAKTVGL